MIQPAISNILNFLFKHTIKINVDNVGHSFEDGGESRLLQKLQYN